MGREPSLSALKYDLVHSLARSFNMFAKMWESNEQALWHESAVWPGVEVKVAQMFPKVV